MTSNMQPYKNVAIIGAGGALGQAFLHRLSELSGIERIYAFSRNGASFGKDNVTPIQINYENEASISMAANKAFRESSLDLILVTTGILHEGSMMPEKSLRDLSIGTFQKLFFANTIVPALVAKHFLSKINKTKRVVFAVLSARVGSISDNHLGGWYSYRASKAALNMVIKNIAIEMARRNKESIIIGLHPGTVDRNLSKPFQSNVPENRLFSADYSAKKLLEVLNVLKPSDSGKCFAWDGSELQY